MTMTTVKNMLFTLTSWTLLLLFGVGIFLPPTFTAAIPSYDYINIYNQQRKRYHNEQHLYEQQEQHYGNTNDDDVQELYITQKLDHFDPLNSATYQQRYFVSHRYVSTSHRDNENDDDERSPTTTTTTTTTTQPTTVINFLCVGGEGPGFDKSVLVDSVHCSGDMLELASIIMKGKQQRYQEGKKTDQSDTPKNIEIYLYALEHRYYGKSYPSFGSFEEEDKMVNSTETYPSMHSTTDTKNSPLTVEHLKYLSSRQALEDLAHFVNVMNTETTNFHNVNDGDESTDIVWVTFGGSYPGYMALNARYKYPHLIHAAVSSSAPLQLEVDFPGYKARQGWDIKYPKVGGSQECFRIVKTGHDQAVSLLTSSDETDSHRHVRSKSTQSGAEILARKFHICNPETTLLEPRNAQMLLGDGLINIPAQSNDPSCSDDELCSIAGLCKFIEDEFHSLLEAGRAREPNAELAVLVKVAEHQRSAVQSVDGRHSSSDGNDNDDDDCMTVDYYAMLEEWSKPTIEPFGWRSWLWQTCTEVGFYQTCLANTDCPFGTNYHTVDLDLEICQTVFNFTPSQVYDNIQATLDHYGGMDIDEASRVLSVNGNVDPWSVLALQTSPKYSLPVAWADGASHHFWTHPVKDTDTKEVNDVRKYIYDVVMNWLGISDTTVLKDDGMLQQQ